MCDTQSHIYNILLYLYMNHLSEARAQLNEIRADFGDREGLGRWNLSLHSLSYQLSFLENDSAGMSQELSWAFNQSKVSREDVDYGWFWKGTFIRLEANTAAYFGKLEKARKLLRSAVESAKRDGDKYAAWGAIAQEALLECLFGDLRGCLQRAGPASDEYGLKSRDETSVFALALTGETRRPDRFVEIFVKKPAATWVNPTGPFPLVRAQLWLNRGSPEHAVEILKGCAPTFPMCSYLRAYANLAVPHLDDAEADFQTILDHRGMVVNDPVGALSKVGLGRTRAQKGDTAGAKTAYEDFLTLWKDADPDIPILKQAKAEYAKLQ
jgi:hypothetical protein